MEIKFNTETIGETLKRKAWEVKHDAEIKVNQAIDWGMRNKEFCILAAPVVFKGVDKIYRLLRQTKEERLVKEQRNRFWDPRTGRFAYSKRNLSRSEEDYIERQYKAGRSYRDILGEMGVLR